MALDEFLFGKIASFFKIRKKKALDNDIKTVKLIDIKPRLTIFARAITGQSIEIYPAEREGGYKNNSFFLPMHYAQFDTYEENLSFYLFRILFMSFQSNININWTIDDEYTLDESRSKAIESATIILPILFSEFTFVEKVHTNLLDYYNSKIDKKGIIDLSFIYGKWMRNEPDGVVTKRLQNFNEKAKKAIEEEITTISKANPVEEIITLQVDQKAQDDFVMTHNFEKVDSAEEYDGGWRDFDGDDEMDKHEKALEELNMKFTVRVDDTAHSVYQADFVENVTVAESDQVNSDNYSISYDEWDYKKRKYKPDFCKVYPKTIKEYDVAFYKKTIKENASTLMGLRKMLSNVNNRYKQLRRQPQGDSFDLDALTDLFIDAHSGHTPSENVYLSKRKLEKDLSILMLLDVSLSSDGYANGNKVIDVEKQTSILFGEILNEFNVDFAIDCFYSKTRNFSTYLTIKGFDDDWDKTKNKVGAVQPEGYTRIGTALRHSGSLLEKRDTKNKWVILISDGKPNDYDRYEGKYGINDVKQALRELNAMNINAHALAIEAQAKYYLPQMFGQNHYQILTTPVELLEALVVLYDKIKHSS